MTSGSGPRLWRCRPSGRWNRNQATDIDVHLNEQDTRAKLIDPALKAVGEPAQVLSDAKARMFAL